jgi:hypothetical protein
VGDGLFGLVLAQQHFPQFEVGNGFVDQGLIGK